jgi:hypothetical protein
VLERREEKSGHLGKGEKREGRIMLSTVVVEFQLVLYLATHAPVIINDLVGDVGRRSHRRDDSSLQHQTTSQPPLLSLCPTLPPPELSAPLPPSQATSSYTSLSKFFMNDT